MAIVLNGVPPRDPYCHGWRPLLLMKRLPLAFDCHEQRGNRSPNPEGYGIGKKKQGRVKYFRQKVNHLNPHLTPDFLFFAMHDLFDLPRTESLLLFFLTTSAAAAPTHRSVFPVLRPSRVDLPKDPEVVDLQRRLGELKLSNRAIEDRETARIAATKALLEDETRKGIRDAGNILRSQTPWYVMVPYKILCWFLGE